MDLSCIHIDTSTSMCSDRSYSYERSLYKWGVHSRLYNVQAQTLVIQSQLKIW